MEIFRIKKLDFFKELNWLLSTQVLNQPMSFLGMGIGVFLNAFHNSTLAILTLIIFPRNFQFLYILIIQRQNFMKESLKSSKTFYFSNENLKNNKL
jgi:hypothetical protein